jgi:hypothetical protein
MPITDVLLLLIILIGLLRPRRAGGGKVGLTRLLWKRVCYRLSLTVVFRFIGIFPIVRGSAGP